MKYSRTYPPGIVVPQRIHCPGEVLTVERRDRVAVVQTTRNTSIRKLASMGFEPLQESEPAVEVEIDDDEDDQDDDATAEPTWDFVRQT